MTTATTSLPLISQAKQYLERTAVIDSEGEFTYEALLGASARVATALLNGRDDLGEERVAFLVVPGFPWVAVQWGIWRAGGIAVPLPLGYSESECEYMLADTRPTAFVYDEPGKSMATAQAARLGLRPLSCADALQGQTAALPEVDSSRRAMILYTSGTTSRPKGVVTTHDNITAQIRALVEAWAWSQDDRTVLCLPLNHVHGIVNIVSCTLWSGAACDMLPRFDSGRVWERLADGRMTVFMAVPTIYVKLIAVWQTALPEQRAAMSAACKRLRLMVSGSAALPVATLERWKQISGHTLLERYGMTEIGMALSNPLRGERVPGSVGVPLPDVQTRLVDENGAEVAPNTPGEIEIRGPSVFQEYWGKPDATREAFRDGWFRTGDMGIVENGVYRILGRKSIDIIKTGGNKVSALEIEEVLREHPAVADCAVVGVPDEEWGERVAAALVLQPGNSLDLAALRSWAKERLAVHKVPSRLLILEALPRNTMGKVTKPAIKKLFE